MNIWIFVDNSIRGASYLALAFSVCLCPLQPAQFSNSTESIRRLAQIGPIPSAGIEKTRRECVRIIVSLNVGLLLIIYCEWWNWPFFELLWFLCCKGMDIYSNILYVKEMSAELSYLAHRAMSTEKYRPETCCIVGNYYSLKTIHNKVNFQGWGYIAIIYWIVLYPLRYWFVDGIQPILSLPCDPSGALRCCFIHWRQFSISKGL